MATINNKDMVNRLIANNGHYEAGDSWKDDPGANPPVLRIIEYDNAYGGTAYGLVYPQDPLDKYSETEFVRSPRLIFEHRAHADCNHEAGR